MSDNLESLTLEVLRRIDRRLDNIEGDIHDLKMRVTALDEHTAGMLISLSGINNRMDRFDEHLARVERRLDLSEAR
ncbi:hypothetical protein [Sphingomonas sp.]|uniref:hypothetical protein n=1 Tax=Sphingomonas sp. TaxID=28214 RepID=UPI003B00F8A7